MGKRLRPIERKRVSESIVEQLTELILDGTWGPGQRIPSERELSDSLNVGRTSVREALRILETMGYLEIRIGDGSYVREGIPIPFNVNNFINLVQADETFDDLMEARELIEQQIAFIAAESATQDDLQELRAVVAQHADAIGRGDPGLEHDIQFHMRLAMATGNRVLFELQQILLQRLRDSIHKLLLEPGRPPLSVRQHREVIEAIEERDPIEARKRMVEHLRSRFPIEGRNPPVIDET
jgi:GntR family transcriptional repressor for pyruvate dehydrogenase complex